jgi:protein dithiol oxidoreductase (disulfide-forming)
MVPDSCYLRAIMKIPRLGLLTVLLMLSGVSLGNGASPWKVGENYFLIVPAQPTSLPRGKVEVTEVFSYGCIVCNSFLPVMHRLISSLPANAVVDYVPASFIPAEDWPVFQRAYLTAQVLGIADRAHDGMFEAIWKTGELAIMNSSTGRPKSPLPTIEDVARFYNRTTGIAIADFVAAANSMGINTRVNQADSLVMVKYQVSGTPTIIVNGKYRLDRASAGNDDKLIELVKWLVAKESH